MNEIEIKVRLFAIYREEIGKRELIEKVPAGSTADDVLLKIIETYPRLQAAAKSTRLAVNGEYVVKGTPVNHGDEVAFIPPVSGGAGDPFCAITEEPIVLAELIALVEAPDKGGIVTFLGVVRNNNEGRTVTFLVYEAYDEMALRMMARIVDEVREKWGFPVAITHRLGRLNIGEASVAIAAAAPHRAEAFAACEYAINRLKEIVPVWKKEHFQDGSVWVGSAQEPPKTGERA